MSSLDDNPNKNLNKKQNLHSNNNMVCLYCALNIYCIHHRKWFTKFKYWFALCTTHRILTTNWPEILEGSDVTITLVTEEVHVW